LTATSGAAARTKSEARAFLETFALCGFALAQPVLDVFGKAPEEFVFRGADTADIVLFGVVVTVLPALVLWAIEAAVGLVNAAARHWTHVGILSLLAALFVLQLVKDASGVRGILLGLVAAAAGVGFGWLYRRYETTRTWVTFAAIGPVLFLGLFLFTSPVSDLIGGTEAEAAALDRVENPVPVVLVVLDEFPLTSLIDSDGDLDEELYPNLTRFADDGTWYRNATAVTNYTSVAVPAILTGRYPEGARQPLASDYPESLFTLLGGSYDVSAGESTTRLCPTNICESPGASEGVGGSGGLRALLDDAGDIVRARVGLQDSDANPTAAFIEDVEAQEAAVVADAQSDGQQLPEFGDEISRPQPERFNTLLDSVSQPGTQLSYLHLLLPHIPYRFLPDGQRYPSAEPQPGNTTDALTGGWIDNDAPVELGRQRALLQTRYVDGLIGELIDTMEEAGTWDDALVVVTSDHGSVFLPGESPRGSAIEDVPDTLYPQIAWIPMFVHYPDADGTDPDVEPGTVSDRNVESIDIVPTVADVLGVAIPWDIDGVSMLDPDGRPTDEKTFYEARWYGATAAGDPVEFDGADYYPDVLAQGVDSILPAVGDPLRSYTIGAGVGLVGEEAAGLSAPPSPGVTATLDQDALEGDIDPDAAEVPVYLSGHLEGASTTETVVVAVNGRVGGVSGTYAWDGHDDFFALVIPPELLTSGPNTVDVFLLRDGTLVPVGS